MPVVATFGALIALLVWSPSLCATDAPSYGGIRVIVTGSKNAQLTGARVTVAGTSLRKPLDLTTDVYGAYSVWALPEGEYVLSASVDGVGTAQSNFAVVGGKDGVLNLRLAPAAAETATRNKSKMAAKEVASTRPQLIRTRSLPVDVQPRDAEAQVARMTANGYTITEPQRKYIVESINREDLAFNVARSAEVNEIIFTPDVDAAVRAEYLYAYRDLRDVGVPEADMVRLTPQVLSGYVADIASGRQKVAGLKSRFIDAVKLFGSGLFYGERNAYGRLKISLSPAVADFLVRVDAYRFQSPQKPLVIIEGSHKVSVDVGTKVQCDGKVVISQGELRTFPCAIRAEAAK